MERLTAKTNEKIKLAAALRGSSKARRENGMFFLEGARLCADAAACGVKIRTAFFTESALEKYSQCAEISDSSAECYVITTELAAKLTDTQNPQGVFCVCENSDKMSSSDKINTDGKYILLENLQDPSNLGAIIRTAEALGLDGLIVCGGCDVYNPKALRASMGSAFRLPVIGCEDAVELLKELSGAGMTTLASTPDSSSVPITEADISGGVVCVVGNEGNGVSAEVMAACSRKVTIPMGGRAESLNASTAAAILIWEMVRK